MREPIACCMCGTGCTCECDEGRHTEECNLYNSPLCGYHKAENARYHAGLNAGRVAVDSGLWEAMPGSDPYSTGYRKGGDR